MDESATSPGPRGDAHHASYVPRLSIAERDRRWSLIRERMAVEGLECLLIIGNDSHWDMGMANMRYVTHIGSKTDAIAIFPLEGEPIVWTQLRMQHIPSGSRYLHTQDWVRDIRPISGPAPIVGVLREKKYDRGKIGLVGMKSPIMTDIVPWSTYEYFRKGLPDATFVDATILVEYLRIIKSPEEIAMLEKAGGLARKMVDTLIASAEPGTKECELYANMIHTEISNGGEPVIFNLLSSGPVSGPAGNRHLLHGSEQPAVPSMRTLGMGDLVITEFHASWAGYLAAAEFSVFIGKAPGELKRIHDVSVQCLERLIEKMRPGNTLREVWEAEREPCYRAGMDFVELGFHGHGLASPEHPIVVYELGASDASPTMTGEKIGDLLIREDMVFGMNIDIHDPRWNKDVGLMLGDTLHVTKNGARLLVNIPLDFPQKALG